MENTAVRSFRLVRHGVFIAGCVLALITAWSPKANAVAFTYDLITEPILSATFSADFGALTAHRTVSGFEVNSLALTRGSLSFDLSDILFGTTDALSDPAVIDQGLFGTGIVTAAIDSSFFAALVGGGVDLLGTFTDTLDGLFAIDFLSLTIETAGGTTVAFIDSNNGFGIGIPDGGVLPSPLPISIAAGATGTGFDEAISSISFAPAPEPATTTLLYGGLGILWWLRRAARN